MKKATLILGALALVLGLSQCRKPNAPTINGIGETQHIIIKANNGNDGSKVNPTVSGAVLGLTWETEDEITVTGGAMGTLTLTNGAGETDATFEGVITKVNDNDLIFTCGSIGYTSQEGDLAWIKENIRLVGTSEYKSDGNYDVNMGLPYAVLKLDLSAFGTATPVTTVTISAGGSEVASVTGVTNAADNPYYVAMPAAASSEYTFSGGGKTGKATWALAANTFYTKSGSSTGEAIVVAPTPKFSVSATKTVEFSPGNLWYGTTSSKDAPAFHFEANQWDFASSWNTSHVSHFYWSKTAGVAYAEYYNDQSAATGDVFFAATLDVEGETWSTLANGEWGYLMGIGDSYRANASNLRKRVTLTVSGKGEVNGLVILPDGDAPSPAIPGTINEAYLTSNNAVFLPAAGYRYSTTVYDVGSTGSYWSSTPNGSSYAYDMYFDSGGVYTYSSGRDYGFAVRLVRSGS